MYENKEKRKKNLYMVDHGSVFNVIENGSLVVEEFGRGLLIAILQTLFIIRKHHFHEVIHESHCGSEHESMVSTIH